MARRRRNGGNNRGGTMTTGRMKQVAFNPAGLRSGRADGRTNAAAGGLSNRRRSNRNTAAYTGFNAAGFGLKTNSSAASATGRSGNAGASDGRRRTSRNNTTGFNARGGAAGKTRTSSGG